MKKVITILIIFILTVTLSGCDDDLPTRQEVYDEAYAEGYQEGYGIGYEQGIDYAGYYEDGYDDGYEEGYAAGYDDAQPETLQPIYADGQTHTDLTNVYPMEPVESSFIDSVGYSEKDHTLQIRFKTGGLYNYYNVESLVYSELMEADSKGTYFNDHIKGIYAYERIAD